jgi:hypothetical protein
LSAAGTTIEGCPKNSWPEELRWSHTLGGRRREIDEALEREREREKERKREVERRLAPAGVVKGKLDLGFVRGKRRCSIVRSSNCVLGFRSLAQQQQRMGRVRGKKTRERTEYNQEAGKLCFFSHLPLTTSCYMLLWSGDEL